MILSDYNKTDDPRPGAALRQLVEQWRAHAEDIRAVPESTTKMAAIGWLSKCAGELEAALAALPVLPREDGWQDIATAPKDGTNVLLYEEDEYHIGRFIFGFWQARNNGCLLIPTYWRPLPPPPSGEPGA